VDVLELKATTPREQPLVMRALREEHQRRERTADGIRLRIGSGFGESRRAWVCSSRSVRGFLILFLSLILFVENALTRATDILKNIGRTLGSSVPRTTAHSLINSYMHSFLSHHRHRLLLLLLYLFFKLLSSSLGE
jgi:hypothetical protein